jgi:hypothetical protein
MPDFLLIEQGVPTVLLTAQGVSTVLLNEQGFPTVLLTEQKVSTLLLAQTKFSTSLLIEQDVPQFSFQSKKSQLFSYRERSLNCSPTEKEVSTDLPIEKGVLTVLVLLLTLVLILFCVEMAVSSYS